MDDKDIELIMFKTNESNQKDIKEALSKYYLLPKGPIKLALIVLVGLLGVAGLSWGTIQLAISQKLADFADIEKKKLQADALVKEIDTIKVNIGNEKIINDIVETKTATCIRVADLVQIQVPAQNNMYLYLHGTKSFPGGIFTSSFGPEFGFLQTNIPNDNTRQRMDLRILRLEPGKKP